MGRVHQLWQILKMQLSLRPQERRPHRLYRPERSLISQPKISRLRIQLCSRTLRMKTWLSISLLSPNNQVIRDHLSTPWNSWFNSRTTRRARYQLSVKLPLITITPQVHHQTKIMQLIASSWCRLVKCFRLCCLLRKHKADSSLLTVLIQSRALKMTGTKSRCLQRYKIW